ncbi:MAG: pyruvate dehydrogenase, partial [Planctomycetes bacterium]|nr:pyruvate dehydrogenase [Planctomycetota bacterium]
TQDTQVLSNITRRALAQMVAMIYRANHRDDEQPGDPKVGGHPAACASSLEILAALHLVVRDPDDFVCCKPHASPVDHTLHHLLGLFRHPDGTWFDADDSRAVMDRLRSFSHDGAPVFQSYHAESDPDSFRFLPSGSVGIPPVNSVYLALAHQYANAHGWRLEQPHFWSLMGDSEFREGSLMEVLPEAAERELGNVTWIVDYNRQSLDGTRIPNKRGLDGTDAARIERTCEANGWRVIQLMHGSVRQATFKKSGGASLRHALEHELTDYHFQTLAWKKDPKLIREALSLAEPKCKSLVDSLDDEEMLRVFFDLGGHDLDLLVEALESSKEDAQTPCIIIAHTLKGNRLQCVAATGNHSAIPDADETEDLLEFCGLSMDTPYELFDKDSEEGAYLAARGQFLRSGIEAQDELARQNLQTVGEAIEGVGDLPESLDINLKLVPIAHTQWMWGQLAAKLVRIGVRDELAAAGKPAGKDLSGDEARWNAIADLILTMAPDVGTSTNINPAMDEKVFGPESETDWERKLEARERLRPLLAPTDEAWSRHIRFEIAEANCMSAAGSFGKMGKFTGVPFLPMMTVYDFFIKRALDQLYYNLYWRSGFVLVGTPSGVSLAPEGAQHSWKSDIQMPNLITWEPSYAIELDWILCDAIRRHFKGENQDRSGVLIRAVTRAIDQKALLTNLRRQVRFKDGIPDDAELSANAGEGGLFEGEVPARSDAEILATLRHDVLRGGYYLIDFAGYRGYRPGENVVTIVTMGALAPEVIDASQQLLARGIYANVIVASSPDLVCGLLGHADGYRHLRENLRIDGALHLAPTDATPLDRLDAIDLAGRRVPIVSVHDGEEGLLDNIGSIVGTRQISLAVRKFSKSGTPAHVYGYQGLDAEHVVEACGRALAEAALERVRVSPDAFRALQAQKDAVTPQWKELWPDPV